jgi:hypothetical protein
VPTTEITLKKPGKTRFQRAPEIDFLNLRAPFCYGCVHPFWCIAQTLGCLFNIRSALSDTGDSYQTGDESLESDASITVAPTQRPDDC